MYCVVALPYPGITHAVLIGGIILTKVLGVVVVRRLADFLSALDTLE